MDQIPWMTKIDRPQYVKDILNDGIVEFDGCVLLRHFEVRFDDDRSRSGDDTGYEVFVNDFRIDSDSDSEIEALQLAHGVAHTLGDLVSLETEKTCRVIVSLDCTSAKIRMHLLRPWETPWLTEDLDAYEQPMMAVDYFPYVAYEESGHPRPNRRDIEEMWMSIINGDRTREDVHAWADDVMFADHDEKIVDPLVSRAIQQLHGFDMTMRSEDGKIAGHGPPGQYYRSVATIEDELWEWRTDCGSFDGDPNGYMRAIRERSRPAAS